jgi:glucose-1-phosphate adenylyltransferase
MGIYVFGGRTLVEALDNEHTDFGHQIIPSLLGSDALYVYMFDGYWEDIGTVRAFFEANLTLTDTVPPFDFFDADNPIYTRARYLPAAKVNHCDIERTIIAPGCIVSAASIRRSIVGIRSHVREGSRLTNCVMMGAQWYESDDDRNENRRHGRPDVGVGQNCVIEDAIIDVNARIGDGVQLSPAGKPEGFTQGPMVVRDGVLCITKNGVIPDGTRI